MVDELSDGWIEEMLYASLQVFIFIFNTIVNTTQWPHGVWGLKYEIEYDNHENVNKSSGRPTQDIAIQ